MAVASKPSIAREIAKRANSKCLKGVKRAKLLGTAAAGGRKRSTQVADKRLKTFKKCLKRMWAIRRSGGNTKQMARAAGTSAVCYGDDTQGVSNSALNDRRSVLARAAAPEGGGKNPLKVLYALDGASGTLDPSFDAHMLPIKHWATAWWEGWIDPCQLERAFVHRSSLPAAHRLQWARVAGPTAALDMSLTRVGWKWLSASEFSDHDGARWDCTKDPPAAITKAMKRAVKQHRLQEIASAHTSLIPEAGDTGNGRSQYGLLVVDFAPVLARLLSGKVKALKDTPEWTAKHAGALLSTLSNGQWTQARRFAVKKWGLTTDLCQLCKEQVGTQLHRRKCRVTTPAGGWSPIPPKAKLAASRIGAARRELLDSTGLLTIKVPRLEPLEKDTFRWYSSPPDGTRSDLTWVIDGSALNTKWYTLATFGFAVVVYADDGELVAWGGGRPPAWIDSASAAEAWALATVTMHAHWEPKIITDCLGLLRTAEAGAAAATKSGKQLARTWAVIAANLDGDIAAMTSAKKLVWMPAHQGVGAIGTAIKSNGKPITSLEWRANRLVDAIAKFEASRGMAPQTTVDLLTSATALVRHAAAQVGSATFFANNQTEPCQLANGKTVLKTIRDVQEAPKKVKCPRPASKPVSETPPAPAEVISDWDTDDEVRTYGQNTKRARVAEQRKSRQKAEADTLRKLITDQAATLKSHDAGQDGRNDVSESAARQLLAAATAASAKTRDSNPPPPAPAKSMWWIFTEPTATTMGGFTATAGEEAASGSAEQVNNRGAGDAEAGISSGELPTEDTPSVAALEPEAIALTGCTTREALNAEAAKGRFWPAANSCAANLLGAVPSCEPEKPGRSRPVKEKKRCSARTSEEAVQSLLRGKRSRHGSGEDPRRVNLQGMEIER